MKQTNRALAPVSQSVDAEVTVSKVKSPQSAGTLVALTVLLAGSQMLVMPARAQNDAPAAFGIKVASCTVSSTRNPTKTYDCSPKVAKACNGQVECEIQIGDNLTDGKDVDPVSGFPDKIVTIKYDCGDAKPKQRGPYPQNNHASLFLECFF